MLNINQSTVQTRTIYVSHLQQATQMKGTFKWIYQISYLQPNLKLFDYSTDKFPTKIA